jgi:hypothetical protein
MPKKKSGRETKVHVVKNSAGKWVVKDFDRNTLVGVVMLDSGPSLKFHSTSFQAETGFRFPREGETVEVAMTSSGTLLSVHGK